MTIEYPIRAVARLTGLSVDTLRAWERRYGAVSPDRGNRGRVYTEDDVQRLLRLRQAVDRGHAIGQIAHMSDENLNELLAGPALERPVPLPTTLQYEKVPLQAEPILDSIARYDFTRADRELSRLASLLPTRALVHEVILPLMRAVGERWHRGEFSVSQEHMASAITRNLLGSVMRLHQPDVDSGRILITAPAGEMVDRRAFSLEFAPDERELLVGGTGAIHRLSLPDGALLGSLGALEMAVASLAVSPDGRVLASTGYPGVLRLWSTADWSPIAEVPLDSIGVLAVAFSPDSSEISVSIDFHIVTVSVARRAITGRRRVGAKGVNGLAYSPDGKYLANACADGRIRVWTLREG